LIVCSCNVLSDTQILATLRHQDPARPLSPGQAYRCLGCAPRCGRCVATVRALIANARLENCDVGCGVCPAGDHHHDGDERVETRPLLIAAE
jgi:bacterioferritin-associated ferredoxin